MPLSALIPAVGRLTVFAFVLVLLSLTGCVKSVYPWHAEEDVAFDASLAGAWIGEGDIDGCLLRISADITHQARHYNFEITKDTPQGCSDLNESDKWAGGGQLLQIGQQRFVELWEDKCDLYTLLKLEADAQTITVVPMDSDALGELIRARKERLQGRVEGHTMQADDVLLTSSTEDLRRFLRSHADDKKVFAADVAVKFHRREGTSQISLGATSLLDGDTGVNR